MRTRTRRLVALFATTLLVGFAATGCGGEDADVGDPEVPATVDPGLGVTEPPTS